MNDVVHDESEVVDHLRLTSPNDGISYVFTSEDGQDCQIAVILTNAADIETYEGAGDTVAASPDGTAGVKITDAEGETCREKIVSALEDFE